MAAQPLRTYGPLSEMYALKAERMTMAFEKSKHLSDCMYVAYGCCRRVCTYHFSVASNECRSSNECESAKRRLCHQFRLERNKTTVKQHPDRKREEGKVCSRVCVCVWQVVVFDCTSANLHRYRMLLSAVNYAAAAQQKLEIFVRPLSGYSKPVKVKIEVRRKIRVCCIFFSRFYSSCLVFVAQVEPSDAIGVVLQKLRSYKISEVRVRIDRLLSSCFFLACECCARRGADHSMCRSFSTTSNGLHSIAALPFTTSSHTMCSNPARTLCGQRLRATSSMPHTIAPISATLLSLEYTIVAYTHTLLPLLIVCCLG